MQEKIHHYKGPQNSYKTQIDRIMKGEDITESTDNDGNVTRQEVPKEFDIELKDYQVNLTNEIKEEKES